MAKMAIDLTTAGAPPKRVLAARLRSSSAVALFFCTGASAVARARRRALAVQVLRPRKWRSRRWRSGIPSVVSTPNPSRWGTSSVLAVGREVNFSQHVIYPLFSDGTSVDETVRRLGGKKKAMAGR